MNKLTVVNAPAGSGKSTEIKNRVRGWASDHPLDKLLCVTYTNRAADELKGDISSANIEVSTIHSFFSAISKALFSAPEVVKVYAEVYGDAIQSRIANVDDKVEITESNERYAEKLGAPLSYENVIASIDHLYYNERPFNSLYRGGLSHDDLLSFMAECARRYPAIYRRVGEKYSHIIIDEYQDTNIEVLEFFLAAAKTSGSSLHLYGDRMQQIYKSDVNLLKVFLSQFEIEKREITNFRSSSAIVNALNRIYNDDELEQTSHASQSSSAPRVHICEDVAEVESGIADSEALVLNVHRSTIFDAIDSLDLFKALSRMPDHGFNARHPAASVLLEPEWSKVNNPLIKLAYGLLVLEQDFERNHFGSVIHLLRYNQKLFGTIALSVHEDKSRLANELRALFGVMSDADSSVEDVLRKLGSLNFTKPADVSEFFQEDGYEGVLGVRFNQVRNSFKFSADPKRSTQHGVKGESHERVVFLAETSRKIPVVHMDALFNLWPTHELSLNVLEDFLVEVIDAFGQATANIGVEVSDLKAADFEPHKHVVTREAQLVREKFTDSDLFEALYAPAYDKFLNKPGVTSAKALFKVTPIEGLLAAYRLFYVGCSRAKTELDVIIPVKELRSVGATSEKFVELGFDVVSHV